MFHLVYVSTATKPFSQVELLDLLDQGRQKNVRLEITGVLLYKAGSFMQALEGEESTVRSLYATICVDSRHDHVLTLVAIAIPKRQFPAWSMGFKNFSDIEVGVVPGYDPNPAFPSLTDELPWNTAAALNLLVSFAKEN